MRRERSPVMIRTAYFIAKFSESGGSGRHRPPAEMGVTSWKDAYDKLHRKLGDGRSPNTFRNSIDQDRRHYVECLAGQKTDSEDRRAFLGECVHLSRAELWAMVRQYIDATAPPHLEGASPDASAFRSPNTSGSPHPNNLLSDLTSILESDADATEKERLVNARIGQGAFRRELLAKWGHRCCVTGDTTEEAIRASHIKPWRDSSNTERLDPHNGLPLIATLDALFDRLLISFAPDGAIIISNRILDAERDLLGLNGLRIAAPIDPRTQTYLEHHRVRVIDSA